MFAIFYVATVAVCKVISGTKKLISNQTSKFEAKINNKTGYWDTNGAYKDPYTDKQIHYENLRNGDRVVKDLKGNVLRNIDEEQRAINIAKKNIEARKQGSEIFLVGKFEDVCPDKLHKGIWKHVPRKTAVYINSDGQMYFRQPTCRTASSDYVYIRVSNGKYYFFGEPNEIDKQWVNTMNEGWDNKTKSYITLSQLADRVF